MFEAQMRVVCQRTALVAVIVGPATVLFASEAVLVTDGDSATMASNLIRESLAQTKLRVWYQPAHLLRSERRESVLDVLERLSEIPFGNRRESESVYDVPFVIGYGSMLKELKPISNPCRDIAQRLDRRHFGRSAVIDSFCRHCLTFLVWLLQ
jgi:hypothetical protein